MSEQVKRRRRPYRSPARAEAARRTRNRIVEAARTLFLEHGFSDTTITAIAEAAGVAPETVYATHRSKAALLEAVVRDAVFRDDEPEEILEQSWIRKLLQLPDTSARIASFARHTARTVELTSPIYTIIKAAGTGAPELDDLQTRLLELRFEGQRKLMAAIAGDNSLRPGLTVDEAAETFSALASPELHHILTAERGWSQRRYAQWLERTATWALLADGPEPRANRTG
jgi:AcrR family transcriptional regulator